MRTLALLAAVLLAAPSAFPQTKFVKSFDSIALLVAANPNDIHNVAIISYMTVAETQDDGPVFRYYPASVAATNTTTIFKPTSFAGRWIRINAPAGTGGSGAGDVLFADFSTAFFGTNGAAPNRIYPTNLTAAVLATDSVSADELNATGVEAELEAVLDLQDLQGAVTDAQVPNTITIDLATLATTASTGDSATAFFGVGTLENARLDTDLQALGDNSTVGLWTVTGSGTGAARTLTNTIGVLVDFGNGASANPSVRHNLEAGSNITLSTNGGALVITASAGAAGDNITVGGAVAADANFTNSATIAWTLNTATTPDDISASLIAGSVWPAALTNADFGDFTVAAGVATIDANAVALTTDTTGNYVADVVGTANEITSTHTPAEGSTATISLPATIDLGGKTSFEIPNAAAPTTDAFGEIAGDNNAWAASRGAVAFFDGTSTVWLVGVLASDTPSNGQVPTFNTGGTITWETVTAPGDITGVGDVASGEAFNGTQGTTLTFNDASGDQTFLLNATDDRFELSATTLIRGSLDVTNTATANLVVSTNGFQVVGTGSATFVVDGATLGDGFETTLSFTDPTADRAVVFADRAGTVSLSGDTLTGDVVATLESDGSTATVIADNSVDGTDIALGSDAAGDVMYYNGTDWVRLAIGTPGQVLEVNAGGTAPEWDTDDSSGDPILIGGTGVTDASGVDLIGGTGVDITFNAGASPDTATFSFDGTELQSGTTLGDGSSSSWLFTFNIDAVDPTIDVRDDGNIVASNGATGPGAWAMTEDSDNGTSIGILTVAAALGANRTYTFRDASGTVLLSGDTLTGEVTGTFDTDGSTALTIADTVTVTGWTLGASVADTASANDNDTSLATTAYVQSELTAYDTETRTLSAKTLTSPVVNNPAITYNVTADPSANTTTNWVVAFGGGTNTFHYMELTQTNNISFASSTNRSPVRSLVILLNAGGSIRTNTLNSSWKRLGTLTSPFTVTNATKAVLSLTCFGGGDSGVSETNVIAAVAYSAN